MNKWQLPLTAAIAKDLMVRSMTTGVPTSEFDRYGGYKTVKNAYDQAGGSYDLKDVPREDLTKLAQTVAQTGVGDLSILKQTGVPLSMAGFQNMLKNGIDPSQAASFMKQFGTVTRPPVIQPPPVLPLPLTGVNPVDYASNLTSSPVTFNRPTRRRRTGSFDQTYLSPDYSSMGVGAVGDVSALPTQYAAIPGPRFNKNAPRGNAATNPSSYFALSPQNSTGLAPGTMALGSSDMPLYGGLNTLNTLGAAPNLSPGMLGGLENAGYRTDRLGNRIYAPGAAPLFGFAKGGDVDSKALLAQNTETLSDDEPEEAINTDPLGSAQKMMADFSSVSQANPNVSPTRKAIKQTKSAPAKSGSAKMAYESLVKGGMGAMGTAAPALKDTDSAQAQMQELARIYQLKAQAAKERSRGFSADTLGAPTLEQPTLTKGKLTKKRFNKGGEAKKSEAKSAEEPSIFSVKSYATDAAKQMFPGQMGQDDQRDAARHMLAAAIMAKKFGPGTADFLGKAHERLSNPKSFFNMLGIGEPRYDYEPDMHNNRLGAELASRTTSQAELEKLVRAMAMQSQDKQVPRKPWTMTKEQLQAVDEKDEKAATPPQYRAAGSPEEGELSQEEIDAASKPAFVTPKSGKGRKEGEISKQLRSGDAYVNMAKGVTELPYDLAGAPMDMVMLARQALTGQAPAGQVGTSDYIKRKMTAAGVRPEPPADSTAKGFYTAGELLSNLTNPAGVTRAGVKGAQKVGQAATGVAKDFQEYNRQLSVPGASYVTKKPGGNWYPYSVENALLPLKTPIVAGETAAQRIPRHEALLQDPSLNRDQLDRVQYQLEITKKDAALDSWIDNNLTNYVKKQMGTPNDPVRKLAEDGITHLPQNEPDIGRYSAVAARREKAGFSPEDAGTSPQAKLWEYRADEAIRPRQMGETLRENNPGGMTIREAFTSEPGGEWAAKVPDTEVVNELRRPGTSSVSEIAPMLGFDHITDVLREDLTAGRLRPDQLNAISMADAVRRTHQYDQELAAKMNSVRAAAREGLPVYKSYPEGYRWIQLNRPGSFTQESDAMGHSVRGYEPPKGHPDWVKGSGNSGSLSYGHGGWEAIKSGEAKVYSLVDAKGEPHTTIEVAKGKHPISYSFKGGVDEFPKTFEYNRDFLDLPHPTPEQRKLILNRAAELYKNNPNGNRMDAFQKAADEIYGELPGEISQIKGKQNAAPKKEYLPFVQDFVKKGNWLDVRDLSNTGLIEVDAASELANSFKRIGKPAPTYVTQDELTKLSTWRRAGGALNLLPEGFARGGAVDKNTAFIKAHS